MLSHMRRGANLEPPSVKCDGQYCVHPQAGHIPRIGDDPVSIGFHRSFRLEFTFRCNYLKSFHNCSFYGCSVPRKAYSSENCLAGFSLVHICPFCVAVCQSG